MLQLWHQLAVKTAHCVSSEKSERQCRHSLNLIYFLPVALPLQMRVDFRQLGHQGVLAALVLLYEHQFELAVDVLNDSCHLLVLGKTNI